MRIDIVTIFPEFFGVLDISLLGKARQSGLIDLRVHNLRDFTHDRHRTVDDTPYGGGAGMVMK
ncbi:MAG: tRNA (guanosine(37)-N1)-methyltransferase TrmD, partial [Cryobacterium sp.]